MIGLREKIIGGLAIAALLAVMFASMQARHWKKVAENRGERLVLEVAGHRATKAGYRQAQQQAQAAQELANRKIEDARASLSKEIAGDYEKRLAAARFAAAERVRYLEARAAAGRAPRHDPLPGPAGAAAGADGTAPEAGLSDADRLIATEQAIQLEELQRWVRGVLGVK